LQIDFKQAILKTSILSAVLANDFYQEIDFYRRFRFRQNNAFLNTPRTHLEEFGK